jgi:hypothetical protein
MMVAVDVADFTAVVVSMVAGFTAGAVIVTDSTAAALMAAGADWGTASFSRHCPGITTPTGGTECPTTTPTILIINGTVVRASTRLSSRRRGCRIK